MRNLRLILLLILCLFFLTTPNADAQTSLKIQPSLLQIRARSPSDIRAPFKLVNAGEDTIELKILLKRFRDSGEQNGKVILSSPDAVDEHERDGFLRQVDIMDADEATQSLTLGPRQEKELTLSIKLTKDTPQADHYFTIIFQSVSNQTVKTDSSSSFSKPVLAVAMPVLLSINADTKLRGLIDEFSGPLALQEGPAPFTVKIKNSSEHFITAKGVILITNMFGQTVGRVDIPSTNILANTTRSLSNYLDNYKYPKVLWKEQFLLGFYSAKLAVAISPSQTLYTQTVYFAAFPFVAIVVTSTILILGIFFIRRIKKKASEE